MPTPGRSADDLPLAAYSTGVDPETEPAAMAGAPAAPAAVAQASAGAGVTAPGVLHLDGLDPAAALPVPEDEPKPPVPNVLVTRARAFAARNPRLVAGSAFVVAIVVGLSMLLGGKGPIAAGASASPSIPPIVVVAAEPGSATLVLTGSVKATFTMTGTAAQPVAGNLVGAAWGDPLQNVLTLQGKVDRGTRTTDAALVLTWGLMVEGKLVTFTSKAGECTIGMASNPKAVSGSFACRKLKSDDGKLTVEASGTYRT
jgi:hypothetical protein